ncbi:RDD family protein [Microbacterium sp.]|uniref:RDD family protein n=1 Tax=Microbacterium sp. TaxID=51671 RepID=UPI0025D4FE09|nr:RDD family protein [Microbacterium sp.]
MTEPAIDSIAPISRRAVAYLIDALIAGGVAIVAAVIVGVIAGTSGSFEAMLIVLSIGYGALLLVLLAWLLVYTAMQAKSGSIGMRAQGVRLASAEDGMPVGFGRALLRNVVFGVSGWIIVGYFTPLFDSSGRFQGWHDRVAKAVVLDARKSPLPVAVPDFGPAPATTAVPIPQGMPGIPGIPAPGGVQGGFATPPTGAFAFAFADAPAPSAAGAPVAPVAPPAPPAPPAPVAPQVPPAHGVPPVPIVPPGPVPPLALGQPQSAGVQPYSAPPVHDAGTPSAPTPPAYQAPAVLPAAPAYTPPTPQAPAAYTPPVASAPAGGDSPIAYVPGVAPAGAIVHPPQSADSETDPELYETLIQKPAPAQPEPAAPVAPATSWVRSGPDAGAHPVLPASAAPVDAPLDPHEAEIEATRISIPGHGLVFTWDDGARMTVTRRTIFGRNPAPEAGTVLVTVRDETLSLSKTHFEAAADVSGGWVLDRHSTNGMTIVRDGQRIACPSWQRVPVRLGDAIEIGDRIVVIGGYA